MSPSRPAGPATVLLAPDKFKGSLSAREVVVALETGLRAADPTVVVRSVPVADGGDGTVSAALAAGFERVPVTVTGPTGEQVSTCWAREGATAVVELADACGLERLPGAPAPLAASSRGLGDVLHDVLRSDVDRVVVGIGGSASTDGGAGMLAALGARLLDRDGRVVTDGGGALADVVALDLSGLPQRLGEVEVLVACDVDNPLTGPEGAAAVYGPQKGATPAEVEVLDAALASWADVVAATVGTDHRDLAGAGAAGGVGLAAVAVLGAVLRPGVELVLDLVDFGAHVAGADLVVVGEGSLDEQSLRGKAPVGVATAAGRAGVPVVAVCGRRQVTDEQLRAAGILAAHALSELEPDPERSIAEAGRLLEQVAPLLLQHGFLSHRGRAAGDPRP
ncbi:glycerate kinase [Aeromicrobium sp. CF4.19]|uniref:glycerate kinase n=1 Tax=Aeromicrobium sp. CF4.19 TaxID=3373082 RepID=UPI003EE816DF